jgi:hypothetical protein
VKWPANNENDGFVEGVANKVLGYLMHSSLRGTEPGAAVRQIEQIYGAANSPGGRIAVGCAEGAVEGWNETAETRAAYPDGAGFLPSVLYTVVKCAAGAAELE